MKYPITKTKFTRYIYTGNNELTRTEGGPVPYEINVVNKNVQKCSGGHQEVAGHQAMHNGAMQDRVLATVYP